MPKRSPEDARLDRELQRLGEHHARVKTRKEQLLEAFRAAGKRGLTGLEMQATVGVMWRLRLRELADDGCVFIEHPSRVRTGTFRWALILEPEPSSGRVENVEPLLEPPPAPPTNAIFGDRS